METSVMDKIMEYVGKLDWTYIVTVIILSYFIAKDEVLTKTKMGNTTLLAKVRPFLLSIPVAWRVFVFGILYGVFVYWVRGYTAKEGVETMANSLIFAMVFNKLLLQWLTRVVDNKLFPQTPTQQ